MTDQLQGSEVKRDGPHAKPLTLMSPQLRERVSGRQGGVVVPCSLSWQRCGQRATWGPEDESRHGWLMAACPWGVPLPWPDLPEDTPATQDPPPAEECPLPLAGAGSAFPSLSGPAFYSLPSPSLFLSLCACVCLYLSPSLLPSFCLSPFLPHPQFFWSGGWEQQKQPAARAARRSLIRASWELGRGWGCNLHPLCNFP